MGSVMKLPLTSESSPFSYYFVHPDWTVCAFFLKGGLLFLLICTTDGWEEGKRELHVQADWKYRLPSPVSMSDSWSRQEHSFVGWL